MHFVVIDKPRVCVLDLTNPPILASLIAAGLFGVMVILAIIALLVRCCKDIGLGRYDVLLRSPIHKHCRKTCRKICHKIIITQYLRCHKIILRHVVNEFTEFIFNDRNFFSRRRFVVMVTMVVCEPLTSK